MVGTSTANYQKFWNTRNSMKRILIINPNSSEEITRDIQNFARLYVGNEAEVATVKIEDAPEFIETYQDEAQAGPGMTRSIQKNQEHYDGFLVACHSDPNLDLMKEVSHKPVVGIGESSMHSACLLGDRFAVISATTGSIPNKEALIRRYNLGNQLASVRPLDSGAGTLDKLDLCERVSRDAVDEDGAEVIVLGCADLVGISFELQERLGLPVVDGIASGLSTLLGFIDQALFISKVKRYGGHV